MREKTLHQTERWLKSCLKRKVSISEKTLIAFLIAGTFGFIGENLFADITNDGDKNSIHVGTVANDGNKNILVGNVSTNGNHSLIFAEKTSVGWHGGGDYKIAFGNDVGADGSVNYGIIFGDSAAHALSGSYKFIFGNRSGYNNGGNYNFAFGENAGRVVAGDYNFAFGYDAGQDLGKSKNENGTEVGGNNISLMQGAGNQTKGSFNTAIGFQAGEQTKGHYNFALGPQAGKVVVGNENVAMGSHAGKNVTGDLNYSFGINAGQDIKGRGNYAIGENAGRDIKGANDNIAAISNTKGWSNYAIGKGAGNHIIGNHNYSLGENAGNYVGYTVNWNDGVFVDNNNPQEYVRPGEQDPNQRSGAEHNIALGANSGRYIAGQDNIALGQGAGNIISGERAGGAANTAIGKGAGNKVYGDENVSMGSYAGNDINGHYNISVGLDAAKKIKGNNNIAIGSGASNTNATSFVEKANTISLGTEADATKNNAIAIGKGAKATGEDSISIGTENVVSGNKSGAIGDPSYVSGTGTYTIGNDNGTEADQIAADNAGAFGNSNKMTANADESRIVGNSNTVSVANAFVLGNNVTANVADSVYLGKESAAVTDDGNTTAGATTKYDKQSVTANADNGRTARTIELTNFAGHTPVGVVTVGKEGAERRIQNVAAGKISATSTDAVNGSQLYALASKMTDIAGTVAGNVVLSFTGDNYKKDIEVDANADENKEKIGKVNLANQNLAINGTAKEIVTKVDKDGQAVTISLADDIKTSIASIANKADKSDIAITTLTITDGKVADIADSDKAKFVTAETIKTAINDTGFYVSSATADGTTGADKILVKAGEEVKFKAGKNVTIDQNGKEFTFSVELPATNAKTVEYFSVNSTENGNKNNNGASVTNSIAIGPNASVWNEGGNGKGGIAIGNGAQSHVMTNAKHEEVIRFGRKNENLIGGIAVGHNTHARIGTIDIGNRDYMGEIGDMNFEGDSINVIAGVGATTVGDNSINRGNFSTINGSFNVISKTPAIRVQGSQFERGAAAVHNAGAAIQGLGSSIVGSLNSIEANEPLQGPKGIFDALPLLGGKLPVTGLMYSGLNSHIIGTANRINKSNGSLIFGAGNEITNSYLTPKDQMIMDSMSMNAPFVGTLSVNSTLTNASIKELANTYRKYSTENQLASVGIIGGANKADYALFSSINGVGNILTGSGAANNMILNENNTKNTATNLTKFAAFNQVNGYENKGINISHTALTGAWNEIENSNRNIVTGNNHIIKGTEADKAEGNIVLGFNTNKAETNFKASAKNIIAIGNDIVATENNSVYLGNGSKNAADTATKGTVEYSSDATIITGKTLNFAGGTPTGIVSVGSEGKERRIQNVAAGLISATSTDAINGSQLFAVAEALKNDVTTAVSEIKPVEVLAGTNVTVTPGKKAGDDKVVTYTINAEKTTISSGDETLIKITPKTNNTTKVTDYKIDLADDIKNQIKGAVIRETVVAGSSNLTVTDLKTNTSGGKEFKVDLAKDINLTDKGSLTVGDTKVNNDGLTITGGPSVTSSGINAGDKVISNVKVGEKDTDAVNVSQLKALSQSVQNYGDIVNNNSQRIDTLNSKVNSGLANASAMSALEFQEIGINQAVVAAGVGTFNGSQAVAVGMQTAPTENVRVNVKASVSPRTKNGINTMAAIGASYKFNWK